MSAQAEAIVTAGLRPELFADSGARSISRTLLMVTLVALVLGGFVFRARGLSVEGLADDELNKLDAAMDYRTHGLTGANGEHPFLMKAVITMSVIAAEKWNSSGLVRAHSSELFIPVETAVRLPNVIVGSLTTLLIYLVISELFGGEIALLAAALWAFDPIAIGFNRIAKEDTFLLFFFLLANIFWLRGQRVAESQPKRDPTRYYWAAAVAFGAMVASKYLPQYIAVSVSYYWVFQGIPETRWRLGRFRFLLFFVVVGIAFAVFNPTIFLPDTWHEMLQFASRRNRDSYEFMGRLYPHEVGSWFRGLPWYFYGLFFAVKLPLLTLVAFVIGLPLLFRRKLGDGRYFLLFWMFFWLQFTISGSKFTRYTTFVLPAVYSTAAIGAYYVIRFVARKSAELAGHDRVRVYLKTVLASLLVILSVIASASALPHYRLFTNMLGGGSAKGGAYFTQDDLYDAEIKPVVKEIALRARQGAHVASETPTVCAYYAAQSNRSDLTCVSLSDGSSIRALRDGDYIIAARGRHYFSNDAVVAELLKSSKPSFTVSLGDIKAAEIYVLDQTSTERIRAVAH
ncbi:MAG TPA: glycosyltransferase family 39 protein [Pyrinomonadaceae bacterium]|nr:glycosyltransferase family 39 protein [Pyrinomonadaceae bacterium]